jgi:hypothetical protein
MQGIFREMAWVRTLGPKTGFYGVLPAVLCLAMVWPFGGGWHKVDLMAGSATPGARGAVKFRVGPNGNTDLDIEAHALAAPSSLEPPANHYVVWIEPPGKPAHDLGALSVGQHENGALKTVTPFKRFRIFISAEQNSQESMPSGPTVLSATVTEGS